MFQSLYVKLNAFVNGIHTLVSVAYAEVSSAVLSGPVQTFFNLYNNTKLQQKLATKAMDFESILSNEVL